MVVVVVVVYLCILILILILFSYSYSHSSSSSSSSSNSNSFLLYSVLFCSSLFLFYSVLCYSMLFYSVLFYSTLSYSILFYSILVYSSLLYSILFCSVLFRSILSVYLRLPPFLNNIKNAASLGDFPQYGKLSAELTASCQCVLRFFQFISLKYCACHEKVMPGHTKCYTCHTTSSSQSWRSDAPKCSPSQETSARTS